MAEKADRKTSSPRTIVPLAEPVEWRGETVTEVAYRQPTGGDMRRALNEPRAGERYNVVMEACFGMPAPFFDALAAPDYMAISDICDGFFAKRPVISRG